MESKYITVEEALKKFNMSRHQVYYVTFRQKVRKTGTKANLMINEDDLKEYLCSKHKKPAVPSQYIDVPGIAEEKNFAKVTIYKKLQNSNIPRHKISGRFCYKKSDIINIF